MPGHPAVEGREGEREGVKEGGSEGGRKEGGSEGGRERGREGEEIVQLQYSTELHISVTYCTCVSSQYKKLN